MTIRPVATSIIHKTLKSRPRWRRGSPIGFDPSRSRRRLMLRRTAAPTRNRCGKWIAGRSNYLTLGASRSRSNIRVFNVPQGSVLPCFILQAKVRFCGRWSGRFGGCTDRRHRSGAGQARQSERRPRAIMETAFVRFSVTLSGTGGLAVATGRHNRMRPGARCRRHGGFRGCESAVRAACHESLSIGGRHRLFVRLSRTRRGLSCFSPCRRGASQERNAYQAAESGYANLIL